MSNCVKQKKDEKDEREIESWKRGWRGIRTEGKEEREAWWTEGEEELGGREGETEVGVVRKKKDCNKTVRHTSIEQKVEELQMRAWEIKTSDVEGDGEIHNEAWGEKE